MVHIFLLGTCDVTWLRCGGGPTVPALLNVTRHEKHPRLEVIATGRQGVLVGPAADGYVSVILDGVDDVTEFRPDELTIFHGRSSISGAPTSAE